MRIPSIEDLQRDIKHELSDLQCLESCAERGFSIHDWIKVKSDSLVFMRNMLCELIEIERVRNDTVKLRE